MIPESVRERWADLKRRRGWEGGEVEVGKGGEGYAVVEGEVYDHGVREAEERNEREDASEFDPIHPWECIGYGVGCANLFWVVVVGIWTQLALAYAIHKSFIFIRVPLTAAVTPKVVKTLRGWGWDIGKRKPKGGK